MAMATEVAARPSSVVTIRSTVAWAPFGFVGDAGQTARDVETETHVAHGRALAHHGVATRDFMVPYGEALIRKKAGDAVMSDTPQRAFFDKNGVPIK